MRVLTSKKYAAEQGFNVLSRFCFRKKAPKCQISRGFFLREKQPLVATFSKMCELTSTKFVAEQAIKVSNLLETLKFFLLPSPVFDWRK